jgi:hypothetical protein
VNLNAWTRSALAAPCAAAVAAIAMAAAAPGARAVPAPAEAGVPVGSQPRSLHLARGVRQVCGAPEPGQAQCLALLRTGVHGGAGPDLSVPGIYGPADLESAYKLTFSSAARGIGETVAVVDAYNDPHAAHDLAVYRAAWDLPACDSATGAGCVTVDDERGARHPLPAVDPTGSWEVEESLDMDMVSAICPNCHILLVEASSAELTDIGEAEDTAVRLGAKFVSDSWGFPSDVAANHYFNHPGVAITAAAGDSGIGTYSPASTQFVTSVGGTTLVPAKGTARGWRETVWSAQPGLPDGATSSGCGFDPHADAKPAWQAIDGNGAHGCLNRTDNDVAAVADPNTPVWSYDSYPYAGKPPDWSPVGGTSVASPIIASVYALAGPPRPGTYPASYLYQPGHAAELFKVTKGRDGYCAPAYLCDAADDYPGTSYNGPAGWGTPDGTAAFTDTATGHTITVIDPGTQDYGVGAKLRVPVSAVDSAQGQTLAFSAAGLPAGVHINEETGIISGRLPGGAGTSVVTVTATDSSGASGSASFDIVAVPDLRAAYHRVTGPVRLPLQNRTMCLYDAGDSGVNGTKVEVWSCDRKAAQQWTYLPDASPDSEGTLLIHGKCATVRKAGPRHSPRVVLENCTGAPSQQWTLQLGTEWLANFAFNGCMDDAGGSTRNGTWVGISACYIPPGGEEFILPPGPVLSAVGGTCLNDPHNSDQRVQADARPCNGSAAQKWAVFSDAATGGAQHNRLCLGMTVEVNGAPAVINGSPAELESCGLTGQYEGYFDWFPLPDGMVQNFDSLLCLDNPGRGSAKLVAEPCYGTAGEIWAEG